MKQNDHHWDHQEVGFIPMVLSRSLFDALGLVLTTSQNFENDLKDYSTD